MTNREMLDRMSNDELAHAWFCWNNDCEACGYAYQCSEGHNGFVDWLSREVKTTEPFEELVDG